VNAVLGFVEVPSELLSSPGDASLVTQSNGPHDL